MALAPSTVGKNIFISQACHCCHYCGSWVFDCIELEQFKLEHKGIYSGKMEEENQIFYRNCGEILRMAINIESELEFFISNYFCSPQGYKTFLFKDLILVKKTEPAKFRMEEMIAKTERDIEKVYDQLNENYHYHS